MPRRIPDPNCCICPRLNAFLAGLRTSEPAWHNAPVPPFGPDDARLLVVGLAPGMRGANRTGRPFTGDYAGIVLYEGLLRHGLATGSYGAQPDDGLEPGCRITNAVRCLPPQNKPTGEEVRGCQPFLLDELTRGRKPEVVLALGRIAHEAVLRALNLKLREFPFAHGGMHNLPSHQTLISSYHFSRYNMNTGRLTPEMVDQVFGLVTRTLQGPMDLGDLSG